jgi:hypothetical protein
MIHPDLTFTILAVAILSVVIAALIHRIHRQKTRRP